MSRELIEENAVVNFDDRSLSPNHYCVHSKWIILELPQIKKIAASLESRVKILCSQVSQEKPGYLSAV